VEFCSLGIRFQRVCATEEIQSVEVGNQRIRAFYYRGRLLSVSTYAEKLPNAPAVPLEFVESFANLPSQFYTADFAELENGEWIMVETGDGSVSGLPVTMDVHSFVEGLSK
jgi:hypothetical protein